MKSNPAIESGLQQLRNLRYRHHAKGIYDACDRIDRELEALKHGDPSELHAACSQILFESDLLNSFGLGRTDRTLERARHASRVRQADSPTSEVSTMVLRGNWSTEEPLLGEIIPISEVPVPPHRELGEGLPIFVYEGRPSVAEFSQFPKVPCVVVALGGGPNSEDMNYARDSGLRYVNGIGREKHGELVRMRGSLVRLVPSTSVYDRTSADTEGDIPFSTGLTEESRLTLDDIHKRLVNTSDAREVLQLASMLKDHASSDSVQEKYRVGELLSQSINRNPDCVDVLDSLCRSTGRQARFTAARCLSKLVEQHPELISREGLLTLLEQSLNDRSIPNLVVRALGKGRGHPHIETILKDIKRLPHYAHIYKKVEAFAYEGKAWNYYNAE